MKVAKLRTSATIPTRKNSTDAGLDLYLDLKPVPNRLRSVAAIKPNEVIIAETGITVEIPTGHFGWITNKSSSDYLVGGGIVDEGYQGELLVKIFNPTDKKINLKHGQKIAQLLILPCKILGIEEIELSEIHREQSDRGVSGGIGRQFSIDQEDFGIGSDDDFIDRNDW